MRLENQAHSCAAKQFTMDPHKSTIDEIEKAMLSPLDRHGDQEHQRKLTRRIMLKLDTRLVTSLWVNCDAHSV